MTNATVGFRVKSGWSVAVLVTGTASNPQVIERCVVRLADPDIPESTQPFHAGLGGHKPAAKADVRRLRQVVEQYASHSLAELFDGYHASGYRVSGVGIVVGSMIDPATIANEHIRAHAEEGQLFRVVIEVAAKARAIAPVVIREKDIVRHASDALGLPAQEIKPMLLGLGKHVKGSWRADDKNAALAAWTLLPRSGSA
jgi:hypothetical protein